MAEVSKWGALGYQQVPGLANRIISRYLRAQRRNMRRFFMERGLFDLAERMNQIRHSRQGMLAKNRMFQKVLNEYSERATARPATEAASSENQGVDALGLRTSGGASRDRDDSGGSIPEMASADGAGVVIEE